MSRSIWTSATRVGFFTCTLGLAVLAAPGTANADPGSIKVHAQGTPFERNANEPKQACGFYIAAFGASAGETYRVTFAPQGGGNVAGEPTAATDTYTATENLSKNKKSADGRTRVFNANADDPEIETGQYKVTVTNVDDPKDSKSKVFRVVCAGDPGGGTGTPTPTPSPTPGPGDVGGGGNPDDEDPEVGGVDLPEEDSGDRPVGGVDTGGGGTA